MSKDGPDTSGMEDAARESNALQKQMYEEALKRGEPFYQGGLEGFGTLMDYLGLQGGKSSKTESQIYNELSPQFTSQSPSAGMYVNPDGQILTLEGAQKEYLSQSANQPSNTLRQMRQAADRKYNDLDVFSQSASDLGYTPYTTQTTDYDALNSAVQGQLTAQDEQGMPEYFGSLLTPFGEDQFEADAGYQFRKDEGQKALERQLAAQGKTFSPEAAKELMRFNQGTADQAYNDAYNRYNLDQGNIYNRLAGIAGMGQTQIGQLNQAGQSYAGNVGQTNASLANAQAAAAQSKGSMFDNMLGLGNLGISAYTAFSDRTLKENITEVGEEKGHKVYEFNYIGDDTRYRGVMAQEVMQTRPDAVALIGDHYAVDYGRLGLEMREV